MSVIMPPLAHYAHYAICTADSLVSLCLNLTQMGPKYPVLASCGSSFTTVQSLQCSGGRVGGKKSTVHINHHTWSNMEQQANIDYLHGATWSNMLTDMDRATVTRHGWINS